MSITRVVKTRRHELYFIRFILPVVISLPPLCFDYGKQRTDALSSPGPMLRPCCSLITPGFSVLSKKDKQK